MYAARLKHFGLTAYAEEKDIAYDKLARMLVSWVATHAKQGTLTEALQRSNLPTLEKRTDEGWISIE